MKTKNWKAPKALLPPALQAEYVILDPSPTGQQLSEEALPQAVHDFAGVTDIAMLEPMGMACVAGKDGPVMVRRHRLVLIFPPERLREVMGFAKAYMSTVFCGHVILTSVRPADLLWEEPKDVA